MDNGVNLTVTEEEVGIPTADGVCDGWSVTPASGARYPGVVVWPDILGLRPSFQEMARRLAKSGYAVLLVNHFYRSTRAPFVEPGEQFADPEVSARITPWREPLTPAAASADAAAFVSWLDRQERVDPTRGIGLSGYCMNGPTVMRAAAARADRVRAGAVFHGVGMATDDAESPHRLIPRMRAEFLFAVAESDDEKNPREKELIRAAFAEAALPAEVEVYRHTLHGWCPPDNRAYDDAMAERAWARQLALFDRTL